MQRAMEAYGTHRGSNPLPAYLLVALVAFVVFLPWACGYFLGDDWMLYARNSGRPLPAPLQAISDVSCSRQYRPLSELSLGWMWTLFGFNPIGHHVVNFVIHALNSVLVAILGQRLARDRRASLLAGLSFAVLGCHAEAVVWMTARHEMLATAFALLGVISYIKFRDSGKHIWWASTFLLYVISFGFKETALALPLFLSFYDFLFVFPAQNGGRLWRPSAGQLAPLVPLLGAAAAYTLYRLKVGGAYDVPFTLLAPPKNLVYYLLMETVALPASMDFLSRFPLATLPVIVFLAIACALSLWFARGWVVRNRAIWFGVLWMVFALAPVILIVAERTTYVSSVGWALTIGTIMALAWGATSGSSSLKRWLTILAVVVILGANLVTLIHRAYWWDHAADISYDLFSRVKAAMLDLPPGKAGHLWFINIPDRVEYAYAFGNRILFAVWLLQAQAGEPDVEALHIQESTVSPSERIDRLLSEQPVKGPVVAFYWQDGRIVELNISEGTLLP
ncbi:MAG: ArnT family glycosyltransferase [Anaerolineae bacterium]